MTRWSMAALILLVTLALAVLVAPRLLERLAVQALEDQGLAPARLRIDSLGPTGLALSGVSLGPLPAVEIETLTVAFSPIGLLRGELASVELIGASIRGRLQDGRLQLGELTLGGADDDDEDEGAQDGSVPLLLPAHVRAERLRVLLDSPLGHFDGEASIDLDLAGGIPSRGQARAALRLDGAPLATFELEGAETRVAITARADLAAPTLRELGAPDLEGVQLQATASLPAAGGSAAEWAAASQLQLHAELATNRRAPGRGAALEARAILDLTVRDGKGQLEAVLRGPGEGDRRLRIGDATARRLGLRGAFTLEAEEDAVVFRAPSCLAWRLQGAAWGDEPASPGESKGCLRSGEGPLLRARPGAEGWDLDLDVLANETLLSLTSQGEPLVEGEAPNVHLRLDAPAGGEAKLAVRLEGGRLQLSNNAVRLSDMEIEWPGDERVSIRLGRLGLGDPPAVRPLRLAGEVTLGPPFALRAELRDGPGELRLDFDGTYDAEQASGGGTLTLAPLRFRSGDDGLQPEQLLPVLGDGIGTLQATLDGDAALTWKDGQPGGHGQLRLEAGDLSAEGWAIEGLAGALDFVELAPLETAPDQRLSFRTLRAGLPLRDGEIRLRVGPGWEQIEVESASGRLAQGWLRVKGRLDFEAGVQQLDFRVQELSLSELVDLAEVEELEVSGTLAGDLPVVIRGGKPTIVAGRLAADPPSGSIRYTPAAPPAALAGAGAQGELVMRALEDFQYDSFEVDVDLGAEGQAKVLLRLKGSNPAVDGGRPIHLNLDLSGPLLDVIQTDPLMRDLVERVSQGALERATRPGKK